MPAVNSQTAPQTHSSTLSLASAAALLGVICCFACAGLDAEPTPAQVESTQAVTAHPSGAVPIHFSIPSALSGYTGRVPVTFGVPFKQGTLQPPVELWLDDSASTVLDAQFEVSASWPDGSVKWLLVDAIVPMIEGAIASTHLRWDHGGSPTNLARLQPGSFPWSSGFASRISAGGGAPSMISTAAAGSFELTTAGQTFHPSTDAVTLERQGPARAVLRSEGTWRDSAGSRNISQFVTRYTVFRDLPLMRIYHTLVWGRDDQIPGSGPADELGFNYDEPIESLRYLAPSTGAGVGSIGVDGAVASTSGASVERRQQRALGVLDQLNGAAGQRLDGWVAIDRSGQQEDTFVGLRWAAEQFPTAFEVSSSAASVFLLDGRGPDHTSWTQLYLARDVWGFDDGIGLWKLQPDTSQFLTPYWHWGRKEPSPIGLSKTWELWVWREDDVSIPPAVRNALAQGGVRAYADPEFATQAELPSPSTPKCTTCSPEQLTVETAIDDLFTFVTRTQNPEESQPETLGSLHFGDVYYNNGRVNGHVRLDRYWLNHGQDFATIPWMMWMRSGNVKALNFAEAHGRHLMDVDTVHVHRGQCTGDMCKVRGSQGMYGPVPGAFMQTHGHLPQVRQYLAQKTNESEYLSNYYFLTGYERALDVAHERADALEVMWTANDGALQDMHDKYLTGLQNLHNPIYMSDVGFTHIYRTVGELATLYELTGRPQLADAALAFIDGITHPLTGLQQPDGWLPEAGANRTWFAHTMHVAARVFPTRAADIQRMLLAWHEYQGGAARPGPSKKASAAQALWTSATRYRATGDAAVLRAAQSTAYAQARTVHDASSATGAGGVFVGVGPMADWQVGGVVRDWLAVLSLGDFQPEPHPMAYVHRGFADEAPGYKEANRFYALKSSSEELRLNVDTALQNQGVAKRLVRVRTYPPEGPTTEDTYCIGHRADLFYTELGKDAYRTQASPPLSETACTPVGESFEHVVSTALPGVFAFDIDVEDYAAYEGIPFSVTSRRVRANTDRSLAFSGGSGAYVELSSDPRLQASEHMSVAFRMKPVNTASVQIVVNKPYEYMLYVYGNEMWARFFLEDAVTGAVKTVSNRKPLPAPGAFVDVVATLALDQKAGEAVVGLCIAGDCNLTGADGVIGAAHHAVGAGQKARRLSLPLTLGRRFGVDKDYFTGELNDLWIAHRVLSPAEIGALPGYGFSAADWVADAERVGSGALLTFDDGFKDIHGWSPSVAYGVEGVTHSFVDSLSVRRVSHRGPIVRHQRNRLSSCALSSDGACRLIYFSPSFSGALHGTSEASLLETNLIAERYNRYSIDDAIGAHTSQMSVVPTSPIFPAISAPAVPGDTRSLLLGGNGQNSKLYMEGFGPLLAHTPEDYFDALSCFAPNQVASMADSGPAPAPHDGYLEYPDFEVGSSYTVSFKMRAPHSPQPKFVLNKLYEYRAYTMNGRVYVQHYLQPVYPTLVADYPENAWVTVTASVEDVGGQQNVRLFVNGHEMDARLGVAGAQISNAFPLLVGKHLAEDEASFDGLIDDVWVADGVHTGAGLTSSWHHCASAPASAHMHMNAEGAPPAGVTGVTFSARVAPFPL